MLAPRSPCFLYALLLLASLTIGCGDGRTSGQVSGKVTIKGQPAPEIGVNFEPIGSGAGRGSFGRTDASGTYSLQFIDNDQSGAAIGKHRVTFSDLKIAGGQEQPDAGPALPKQKSRLPASAVNDAHEFEVKAGSNQADFDLK